MKRSEFESEIKRRKSEITRRKNKNKGSVRLLSEKIDEQAAIKVLQQSLEKFKHSYYSVVTDFDN